MKALLIIILIIIITLGMIPIILIRHKEEIWEEIYKRLK